MGLLDDLKKNMLDSASDLPQVISGSKKVIKSIVSHDKNESKELVEAKKNDKNIFEKIGCSPKTIEFVAMSLVDGILDTKEKEMLIRLANEDGVDLQEFDFVITKALEVYHNNAKNSIKQLSDFFKEAEMMSAKEIKPDETTLSSAVPQIAKSKGNPYLIAGMLAGDVMGQAISSFIKEPSKLNTFKAEIIRKFDVPLYPEVLVDFFGYASSQITEEKQRNDGKGIFTEWSETLFGKDIDLVPIWQDKMKLVMTKAVIKFGNNPTVMALINEWRLSPLKKLLGISDTSEIENFPIPNNASDYIELLKFTYEKTEDFKIDNREAYAHLNKRLIKEVNKFINCCPLVSPTVDECRVKPVTLLMSNCDNQAFMVQFEVPDNLNDLLEVLNFLQDRKDLKSHYQRIYNEAIKIYGDDNNSLNKIKTFKPKNIFGL